MSNLTELLYCSRVSPQLDVANIFSLLDHSQTRNEALGVSGMLVFNTRFFMQALQGPQDAIDALARVIRQDPRHTDMHVYHHGRAPSADWHTWHAGFLGQSRQQLAWLAELSPSGHFDPYAIGLAQARKLLLAVATDMGQPNGPNLLPANSKDAPPTLPSFTAALFHRP